jgi:hypothetical protein
MAKYYFRDDDDDEMAYTIDSHLEYMDDHNIKELKVFEAKIVTGSDFFYCTKYFEIGEKGQGCGRFCDDYKPRNRKNGRCCYSSNCYEQTDKFRILKLK